MRPTPTLVRYMTRSRVERSAQCRSSSTTTTGATAARRSRMSSTDSNRPACEGARAPRLLPEFAKQPGLAGPRFTGDDDEPHASDLSSLERPMQELELSPTT